MKTKFKFLVACLCLSIITPSAMSLAQQKSEADKTIETCLNMGAGVPSELVYKACLTAFDTAIGEAQKTNIHSEVKRQLLWLQATQAASLSLVTKISMDNSVSLRSCNIALNGLKADNQLTEVFKERFKDLRSVNKFKPVFEHCHKNKLYPEQKK